MKTLFPFIITFCLLIMSCASEQRQGALRDRKPGTLFSGDGPVEERKADIKLCPQVNYYLHERSGDRPTDLSARYKKDGGQIDDRNSLMVLRRAAKAYPKKVVHVEGVVTDGLEGCRYIEVRKVTAVNR